MGNPTNPNQPAQKGWEFSFFFEVFRSPEEVKNLKFEKFDERLEVQPLPLGSVDVLMFLFRSFCQLTGQMGWSVESNQESIKVCPTVRAVLHHALRLCGLLLGCAATIHMDECVSIPIQWLHGVHHEFVFGASD